MPVVMSLYLFYHDIIDVTSTVTVFPLEILKVNTVSCDESGKMANFSLEENMERELEI